MNSYKMGNLKVIDLTKVLDPKTESRRCGLTRFNTGGPIPDFHTIMDLTSHLGTHVECPYHHNDNWSDVESLPITTFMGRAIYVNITHMKSNEKIKAIDLEKACGDRIKEGDIVILDSPMKLAPFTPASNTEDDKRLFICRETAQWLKEKGVKCVGFGDGVSIESNNEDVKAFHDVLMEVNVVFLEVLKNLEELSVDTFFMSYSPLPIIGLDSCPIRAYAIEGLIEFSK
ncbi:cyclase [Clostridium estertheticum]|uniref:Cyclase n=1 Tax=Clostridium estertheticum TaxID=238834 RepID=A0A5N7J0E5_9CLOT|nr:cyclase family protein [Clostridium estertheticum]MBU3157126.1 cyclase family protein [Clostridium estertheticum]MPQ31495.1 cyclase [Clostridium estertheticum]MPQ62168.1 cyclase [Clostridium estertheticum]WAG62298.1 cyclase family protein [Clostridium estertheticum]